MIYVISNPQYGHIYGHENRRILAAGEQLNISQKQLNEYVSDRPEFFQIEEGSINMSHVNEMQGSDGIEHIILDMKKLFWFITTKILW